MQQSAISYPFKKVSPLAMLLALAERRSISSATEGAEGSFPV